MGIFDWLFKAKRGGSGITITSDMTKHPGLKPALKSYFDKLKAIHRKGRTLQGDDVREIGREINAAYGYDGMVNVCDSIRAKFGASPARTLEYTWDGIGEWQS
jgi:hypothetical protein